ncbi:MAG: gliding motility-associated C-terminal domain-containing protein [Bacteroidetes bacterium]|nr:gliding motility-associated C-terminal domain-containing protein [Bacteroidota bacterium]
MKKVILIVHLFLFCVFAGHSADRYWVGGTGAWSDVSHWSVANGGVGGASVPTSQDNTFFTSLSFPGSGQSVAIDGLASCADIYFNGIQSNTSIEGSTGSLLSVYGSMKLNKELLYNFKGDLVFKSETASFLNSAGVVIKSDIYVDLNGGTLNLTDNLTTSPASTIYFKSGIFSTSSKTVNCGSFIAQGNLSRSLQLNKSSMIIHNNWLLNEADNLTLEASKAQVVLVNKLSTSNFQSQKFPYGKVRTMQAMAFSVVITEIVLNKCAGDCKSKMVATVSGGTGPYNYTWVLPDGSTVIHGPTASTTDTLTGVCEGKFYSIFAEDTFDGTIVSDSKQAQSFSPIGIAPTSTATKCFGSCDGRATAISVGGTNPVTFVWSNAFTGAINNNICAGTYTVTATDANGCTASNTTTVNQPTVLALVGGSTNVTCFGLCNGTASVSASGGTVPYTYSWSNSSAATGLAGLCPATYTVTVTDKNACSKTYSPTITQPAAALTASTVKVNVTCFSKCDGSTTITPVGGTIPYTYSWSNGATNAALTLLCAANYTCTVTDANGCTTTSSAAITEPTALVTAPTGTNVTCFGACNGTVNANPSGGSLPYTYSWGPGGATAVTAASLCPATYTVTLTDSKGCTSTSTVAITEPGVLAANATKTDITCNSLCNGSVGATPSGGTTPFSFAWSNGSTAATQFGLCVGGFTVTVIDANSCTKTGAVSVNQPATLSITRLITNASCNGICDGAINTTTNGGTTPYTYAWSSGQVTANLSALCDAGYTVTVTDANNCTATTSATITEPVAVTASIATTPVSCDLSCNATAAASAGGGTAPYTYLWSTLATTVSINGLCAASYTVTITDSKNCSATSTTTITQPAPLTISLTPTNVSCSGLCNGSVSATPGGGTTAYTYSWSSGGTAQTISALCVGGYTLTLTDANGCTATSNVTITAPSVVSVVINASNMTCSGLCNGSATANPGGGTPAYTYNWSTGSTSQTISALCQATYTVTVTDNGGCQTTQTVTITQPTALNASFTSSASSCGVCNGTGTANPSGGSPGYNYTWSDSQSTPTAVGLCVGTYTVTVSDINACTATGTVAVAPTVLITVTTSSINLSCFGSCDGIATANAIGGVLPYTYNWSNTETTQSVTGLCSGSYTVTVTDAAACSSTSTAVFLDPAVIVPNVSKTDATCNGICDGTAVSAPSGGAGGYSYTWSNAATSATVSALCAATYTVTVTDANACTQTSTVTITQPSSLNDNEVVATATCGNCDGTIGVSPSGGSAAYTYAWAGPGAFSATSQNVSGLCIGTYTLTLTAGGTCQSIFNYSISNTAGPSLTKVRTNTLCNGNCDGTATVTPAGTPGFTYNWSTGSTAQTVNGLCAASYTLSVTDGIGCVTVDTLLIKQPSKISPNQVSADITCGGAADGAIILVPAGGTPVYTFSWSNTATTSTITNLAPGPYTFTVTDANGCDSINTVTITEPSVLSASTIATDVTCKGACNGGAFAAEAGGTSPYDYSWSSGALLNIAINLCPNTYTVTVTDANNCTATSTAVVTEPALALTAATGETDVSCNGGSDGTTFVNASGGTPGYSYTWVPGGQTGATATALFAGSYNVTVTDANGCTTVGGIVVNQPAVLSFTVNQVDVSCNSACDGTANVTVAGGTAPFNYLWSNAATGQTVTGLCLGSYTVTATDSKGCTNSKIVTITEPSTLLANVTGTDPSCLSATSGSATSAPAGGTVPYTYNWSNGALTQTINSLAAGSYTVTVTDSNGCTDTQSVTLIPPVPITIVQAVSDANCGACDGTIDVTVSGGTPGYSYLWNSGATAPTLSALCAGNYSLTITDVNTCTSAFVIAVNNTGGPTGETVVTTDNICSTDCNGTVTVTPIGGTTPYTYLWTDVANTSNARTGLCVGSYTLVVTDANGCIRNSPVTITSPAPLVISVSLTNETCSGKCDGVITLSAAGGGGGYVYSWNSGATGAVQSSLCAGTYSVTLTDANSCTATSVVVVGTSLVLTASVTQTDPLCNALCTGTADVAMGGGTSPYVFTWSNGAAASSSSGLCANAYTVSVSDANGCNITKVVTITEPAAIITTPVVITATCGVCNGQISVAPSGGTGTYSYTWGTGATAPTISGLCAGVYGLDIGDANGCTQSFNIPLNNTNGPSASTIVTTDVTCFGSNDGAANVTPNGGTPPYTYLWISTGQTINTVTGLAGGVNLVQITDANGCIRTDTANIVSPTQIVPNQAVTNATCGLSDGQIVVAPTGGAGTYTYSWSGGFTTATITGLSAGTYDLTITDASSCTQTASFPVSNNNAPALTLAIQDLGCNSICNGSTVATPSGGLAPYVMSWSTGATGNTASSLCAGTYTVSVTDANACMTISTVVISEPAALTLTAPATSQASCSAACNGTAAALPIGGTLPYSYSWSMGPTAATVANLCSGTYFIVVTDANGCNATQAITIVPSAAPFTVTPTLTNATCGLCDGQAAVIASGGTLPYNYLWSNGATGATVNSLCAAVYSIDLTDANGCSASFFIPISNTGGPTGSGKSVTNILCNGQCSGGASVAPVGGTAPFTYLWLPSGDTGQTISNLCSGTGFVQITDANGCILTDTVDITEPMAFATNENITQPTACSVNDGAITLSPSGGTAPYTYTWSNAATSATQTNLGAGLYTVTITDAAGCAQSTVVAINNVSAPVLAGTSGNVSCAGSCDGYAAISAMGGVLPYTYLWNNTPPSSIDTAIGLCQGTYFVQVTDAAGCLITSSVTITEPSPLMLNSPVKTDASCIAVCNGSATVLPAGGTLPYVYSWSNASTSSGIGSLCVGNYSVTVTDVAGCSLVQVISVDENLTPIVITSAVTNPTCGICNGTASVNVVGGNAPFSYLWSNGSTSSSTDSLCAGVYSIDIADGVGCQSSFSLPVSNTGAPTASGRVVTDATCFGSCNGSASVSPIGGTLPYTYSWLPSGQTAATASGLCAGLGFVEVADSNGCILVDSILVGSPSQISIAGVTTDPTSCNVNDGSIALTVSGGAGTYTYAWSNSGTGTTQINIGGGTYGVTVTDASGCTQTTVISLNDKFAPVLSDSSVNVSCFGKCDGKAIVRANGGTQPYTYSWSDTPSSVIDTAKTLCAGTYFVQVTDNVGCKISSSVTITEPSVLNLSISGTTKEKCIGSCDGSITAVPSGGLFPYMFSWSSFTGTTSVASPLCKGQYSFTLTDANGCTVQHTDSVQSPAPMVVVKTPVDANCNNTNDGSVTISVTGGVGTYTYNWKGPGAFTSGSQNLAGLYAGSYPVTITDANGCQKLDTAAVNATINVIAKAGNDTSFCLGGSIILSGDSSLPITGTTYQWLQMPALTNIGNDSTVTLTPPAGTSNYMLVAINGVCSDTDTVVVSANPLPVVDAGADKTIFSLQSTMIGGAPTSIASGASFSWTPGKELTDSTAANPEASPLTTTLYKVVVRDANGCVASDTVRLTVLPEIVFNNGITPNGDGKNETWIIDNIQKFPKCVVEVYNRWGDLLFSSTGYGTPWDGRYNGKDLPVGTYYYVIKLNDPLFPDAFTGPITIMR